LSKYEISGNFHHLFGVKQAKGALVARECALERGGSLLELRNVRKLYSGIPVIHDLSFIVSRGEVTGYLGPNGSGKSTTLKMIVGLLRPSEGDIFFDSENIALNPIHYRQLFGYVPEEPQLYPHLTGAEYLEMVGQLRGLPEAKVAEKIAGFLDLFSLYEDRNVAIASYSKGMRQKILLTAALLHNPDLIILDEPFTGLDVNSALILRDVIQSLAARGKAILLSSHELETVERVCSRVMILSKGRIVANNSIENLRSLMSLPTLERVFAQLVIEQDTQHIARQVVDMVVS
jgi:ABC-2 type transport system ATP-binding protein